MGHLPSDVAPDLRSRSYTVGARIDPFASGTQGALVAHGDATCGYSLMSTNQIFWLMISRSGLDIGLDRGTTVADDDRSGRHVGPFEFTGSLVDVIVALDDDQDVDHGAVGTTELGRE